MNPEEAQELLLGLAEEALSGRSGEVVCLEAPEWPPLPASLRRELDGRSIYTRPGGAQYATSAQLSMEERLVAHAQAQGAPRVSSELAARRLGADLAQLRAALAGRARKPCEHGAPRGLRLDQAAAVWHALTSARTVDVITGPAGTGKTRVLAALARAWDGPVFGTATSQNATNGLRQAGIQVAANTTRMLGAIQRGMIPPGSLIVADKGSMISVTHLAALTPDGRLWLLRDTYGIQTAWAPRHVGKELRLSGLGAFDAALGAIRADAEAQAARKAGDHDRAARHDHLAASYRAMRDHYQQQERALARAMADRQEWEQATAQSRHLAIAADTELRRRHPYQKIEPLRSAEPAPVGDTEHEQGHAAPGKEISEMTAWTSDLQAQPEEFRAAFHSRQALIASNADPGWNGLDTLFSALRTPREAAILQPPKPTIAPSARIVERAAEHDVEPEAGS